MKKPKFSWSNVLKTAGITFIIVLLGNKLLAIRNISKSSVIDKDLQRSSHMKPIHISGLGDSITQKNVVVSSAKAQPSKLKNGGEIEPAVNIATTTSTVATMSTNPIILRSSNNHNSVGGDVVPHAQLQSGAANTKQINTFTNNMPAYVGLSWSDFLELPRQEEITTSSSNPTINAPLNKEFQPYQFCSVEIEQSLALPRLSMEQQKWCQWALSKKGGNVVVGKSWGSLKTKTEKEDFDAFNCNAFSKGLNPSCDDSWGDISVANWMKSTIPDIKCKPGSSSSVSCIDNENGDRQCSFQNVQFNFDYMADAPRPQVLTPTKRFKKGFLSADCPTDGLENFFKFDHLYSSSLQRKSCDYVINGTVLVYSHDDIKNLGHTMNDIMNVFLLRWLHRKARHSKDIAFLNIDSFHLGHNHYDTISNPFYSHYNKTFDLMIKGRDFGKSTLCIQHLIMQSSPPKFFIWDSWFRDHECTFRGPSSLFQRYNLEVRDKYGLLTRPNALPTNRRIKVLLLVRKQSKNLWGDSQTSRNHLNQPEVDEVLNSSLIKAFPNIIYQPISFETISYRQQIELTAETTIMIGMHGAGLTQSVHMPIGTKYCCGVIEIFPDGYYSPIRGHANLIRKTGLKYERIDIPKDDSTSQGAKIPAVKLAQVTIKMIEQILETPACILRKAYEDPFMESI